MSHTPGPWEYLPETFTVEAATKTVALLLRDASDNLEEVTANAHIIAAGPELLKAAQDTLQHMREWFDGQGEGRGWEQNAPWKHLIAAIAKAKGDKNGV